ncbi:MAG: hypothetical protein N3G80_02860 [Candidatus Micrarchaeota archaeon]|nr:hypothetical protein [Candidatus Micrarchaeota archaeon]
MMRYAILLAAIFAAFAIFSFLPKADKSYGKIDILASVEIDKAEIAFFSSCDDFEIFVDGKSYGNYSSGTKMNLTLEEGKHIISAKNQQCSSSISVEAYKRECEEKSSRECFVGNCSGTQKCSAGKWGECILPKKICVPGQKVGCSLNSCSFGYRTCNECGTEFGPCMPAEANCG